MSTTPVFPRRASHFSAIPRSATLVGAGDAARIDHGAGDLVGIDLDSTRRASGYFVD
jgi:hypothetical protein